jgi:hypothetical protein
MIVMEKYNDFFKSLNNLIYDALFTKQILSLKVHHKL